MTNIQLTLRRYQLDDLAAIRDLDVAELERIIERLEDESFSPLQSDEIQSEFVRLLPDSERAASALVRQLLSLHGLMRERGLDIDAMFAGLTHGIVESGEWDTAKMEIWRSRESSFKRLFHAPALRTAEKALDLLYEYANLFQSARIITDLRPVFNDDRSEIEAAVVSYTLRLRYDSAEGDHAISIAIDEKDIDDLMKECVRAKQKATKVTQLTQGETKPVRSIVSGRPSQ